MIYRPEFMEYTYRMTFDGYDLKVKILKDN